MSKILSELMNKTCIIVSDSCLEISCKREIECTVVDVDDDWIKITFIDKKGIRKTEIFRVETIERVHLIEKSTLT